METVSLWNAISKRTSTYPELKKDLEVDVAIIGGGITGITAATQLIKAGKSVAILEADKIGGVTTASSTGNLYIAVQPFYQSIYSKFNLDTAKTIAHSRKLAIDYTTHMFTAPYRSYVGGEVFEINGKKCAVSRDKNNQLHFVSAVCTHMKCIVAWNNAEQTWDCPCHGSRFTPKGEVIEGPATINLKDKTPEQ